MKYLLVWSLTVSSQVITGTATFPNKELCLEAQSVITDDRIVKNGAYIGCFEVQPNKENKEVSGILQRKEHDLEARTTKNDKSLNEP